MPPFSVTPSSTVLMTSAVLSDITRSHLAGLTGTSLPSMVVTLLIATGVQ